MGQELVCTARWNGRSVRGKALLETTEVVFRGEERLKIPFSSIRGMTVKDGELQLKTDAGLVTLQLGERAEKWRQKIANPKSVLEKLGVKPGEALATVGKLDREFLEKLKVQKSKVTRGKIPGGASWVFLGIEDRAGLAELNRIAPQMRGSISLWVVYPKGQKTITELDVIGAGRKAGLKDVKVVGFSATHTALKFVIPVEHR